MAATGAYGNTGGTEQYAHDNDVDEVAPPYLQDAELGTSGISQPCDYTGKRNQQLIDEIRKHGLEG